MTILSVLSLVFALGCWLAIVFLDVPRSQVVRPWVAFIGVMVGIVGAGVL